MLRTYRIGVLLLVGLAGLVLLFALFATPASAATSIPRTEIVKRLCDRQEALGSRLRTPLISPSLCGETPPPTPEPTVTLTANPTSVTPGPGSATSTLTWSSTNATSCTAFGGWSGARPTNGSEIVTPGVTTTYQLDCTGPGGVGSDDATVQFVPSPSSPTLTLVKIVVNDGGGAADADDFQARIDGANVSWGVAHTVTVGAHTASEVQVAGYVAGSWGGDCAANGTVTLEAGENKTCTITNNDQQGTLHVVKVVTNDNGGTATTANFSFAVNGLATTTFEVDGQNDLTLDAGTYTVTETATSTYATTYDNCTNVVLPIGGSATCTITNNDIAAEPVAPKLTVTKVVVNDDEGTKVIADFPLFVDGVGVVSGAQNTSTIGAHTVSEANQTGYTAVIGGDCATDGTITLAAGDVKSCTITNNDQQGTLHVVKVLTQNDGRTEVFADFSFAVNGVATTTFDTDGVNDLVLDAGTYTVTETATSTYATTYDNCANIVISNGGSATCTITNNDVAPEPEAGHLIVNKVTQPGGDTTEFVITASGSGAITGGGAGIVTDATNKDYEVVAGTYSVAETIPDAWTEVGNTCVGVVVAAGATETCTITNAKKPMLTVTKVVVNDDGVGTNVIADFLLFVDGVGVVSGAQSTSTIGAHTVSETNLAGYTATIGGNCASDGTITLAAGDVKSCTITNDDNEPPVDADVVINEIAWMGTVVNGATSTTAEWVELKNRGSEAVNLTGWTLTSTDGAPIITISASCPNTSVAAGSFFMLVRTNPSILGVSADCIYTGTLDNDGENLELKNASAVLEDGVDGSTNWEIGGAPQKGNNTTKETAQRAADNTWFTAAPTPGT